MRARHRRVWLRARGRWLRRPRVDVQLVRSTIPRGTCPFCNGRHGPEDCAVGHGYGGRW